MPDWLRKWGWSSPWPRVRHQMTAGVWLLAGVLVMHGTLRAGELLSRPDAEVVPPRWLPWLWPPMFFAAAASLVAFLRHPTPRSYRATGLVVWVTLAGQVAALALTSEPWSWALTTRAALWATAAVLEAWLWLVAGLLVHPEVWSNGRTTR